MRKYSIIAAGLGIALAIGACGGKTAVHPSETSTPPAVSAPSANGPDNSATTTEDLTAPLTARIGETFNVTTTDANDFIARADVTVNSMRDLGAAIPDGYGGKDHATKGRFVVFTITYADTLGAFDYNPFDWSIRMPDGQHFDNGMSLVDVSKYGQDLTSGTLHKGARAKGVITFDIPKIHGTLVYAGSFDGQTVEIKF